MDKMSVKMVAVVREKKIVFLNENDRKVVQNSKEAE